MPNQEQHYCHKGQSS